jgi:hypothetical protein
MVREGVCLRQRQKVSESDVGVCVCVMQRETQRLKGSEWNGDSMYVRDRD